MDKWKKEAKWLYTVIMLLSRWLMSLKACIIYYWMSRDGVWQWWWGSIPHQDCCLYIPWSYITGGSRPVSLEVSRGSHSCHTLWRNACMGWVPAGMLCCSMSQCCVSIWHNVLKCPPSFSQDDRINLDGFITHELPFGEINEAFRLLQQGESLRCMLRLW